MNYLVQNAGYPNMFETILFVVIPAEAGIQNKVKLDSLFHGKPWIPHQVRNDRSKMIAKRSLHSSDERYQ